MVAKIEALRDNANAMEEFAEAALVAAIAGGVDPVAIDGATETTVAPGYYVIGQTDATGEAVKSVSAVMVGTTDIAIKVKADAPSIKKTLVDADTDTAGNAAIGDEVKFQVTGKVPDMTGFTERYFYIIQDTLDAGLTLNADSITVMVDGASADHHLVQDGQTFKIVFENFLQYKAKPGADIVVTYSATLNEDANIGTIPNENSAKLIYSNNPQNEGYGQPGNPENPDDPENPKDPDQPSEPGDPGYPGEPGDKSPVGKTPDQKTQTYTTAIVLTKVDVDGGAALAGATFTLKGTALNKVVVTKEVYTEAGDGTYYKLADGSYSTEKPEGANDSTPKYKLDTVTNTENTGTSEVTGEVEVGSDGVLTLKGLSAGNYTLTEIKAPDGYNLLLQPVEIAIDWELGENGEVIWTIDGLDATVTDGIIAFDVENARGSLLPGTGGMGTTLFTIGGIVLMAGAVLLLVRRRRSGAK